MKYLIILGDGMADELSPSQPTPLQAVAHPAIDRLAREGRVGRLVTVPEGFHPGSEIANLGVLGYDVHRVYEGRGSLEAASIGVPIADGEIAMRCNLVCIADGILKNHSAGHISTAEATELINYLERELGDERVGFYPGVAYRHLLKIKDADKRVDCTPPHDVPGTPFEQVMPRAEVPEAEETAALITKLIRRSQELLEHHPVNEARRRAGKDPANSIWPWSPGYRPSMTPMRELYPIRTGAVISAVDLIHGIGVYAGLDKIEVEGATGLYDTNYEAKVAAALSQLRDKDFVFLHIEASDEAGHEGDRALKELTVRNLEERVVRPVMEALAAWDEPVRVALLPDHPTPIRLRTHTAEPVPFILWGPGIEPDDVRTFDEASALDGAMGLLRGDEFIRALFA
jgi:2,3-bisphosphoglycerate-independent phosphoglycerate mutase